MPIISTGKELIEKLGSVIHAADPIDELRSRGFTLSPALAAKLDTPAAHARFRSAERQRLLAKVRGRRVPTTQIGPLTRNVFKLPGGHHDLTIGLKLEKINQIVADVYARRSIPRDLSLGTGKTGSSLRALLTVLRNELVGVPQGNDIRIGLLHLTGPPTVTALPTPVENPVDPTAHLLVHLPFTLDFDRLPSDGPPERAVATLRAVAHFGIAISTRVQGNMLTIAAGPLPRRPSASEPERLRLTINPDSPLPGKDSGSGDRIGFAMEFGGFQSTLRDLAISTTLAPRIKLPVGEGFDLVVRHIDLRAVPTSGAGHLMIGLEIGAEGSSVAISGQPELLERNPFNGSESTLYVEAHAELFKVLVKQAFASGELERIAKQERSNVRLSNADAELGPNSIGVYLDGELVDECGIFGHNFKDVGFDGWTRVELRGIDAGHIRFETVETIGFSDADILDLAICVALSFIDLKILLLGKALLELFVSKLSGWIFGSSSQTDQIVNLFESSPLPMTELLPRVRALSATIDATAMRIQGALDLVPDTINTYVYARCVTEGGLLTAGGGVPVKGVRVRLLDQDVPPPPGDDAPVPTESTTENPAGPRAQQTVDVSFRPPSADQQLAIGTTDSQGRVQLVISKGRLVTSAGVVTTRTFVEDTQTLEITSSSTQRETIIEKQPDVYLLLEQPNLPQVDTRNQAGGFRRNLNLKHWGTAQQPLVFRVPQPPPVIKGG